MENIKQIFLIGMMGSGKSTIGSILADKLDWTFVDIDTELEKDHSLSIGDMFKNGEDKFRTYETEKLEKIVLKDYIVCATGGGIVLEDSNYRILDQSFCVYLDTSLDTIHKRIKDDNSRPLLSAGNKKDLIRDIFNDREERYKSLSKLNVNTDNINIDDTCKMIMEYINE
ncbi:MAG: shikimate kinase [Candidatus Marinimicrobia bacterium]|nr:shikimate kinase [Gammaproteobacteria bacterium]MBT3944786.1 shikimate kinase [Candidatus Neomarinimicrobiota bacterium]MBT3998625.1 shikimate kinase [Candidatus Neomarinimicrobiota bacterium]MBT4706618.1 shikimate kinase [Candidatus Neomarinimicrobiota bacterium]MBT4926023.1 shikimate kinase [Candidatus Neomarinimicrobiota bacterium]